MPIPLQPPAFEPHACLICVDALWGRICVQPDSGKRNVVPPPVAHRISRSSSPFRRSIRSYRWGTGFLVRNLVAALPGAKIPTGVFCTNTGTIAQRCPREQRQAKIGIRRVLALGDASKPCVESSVLRTAQQPIPNLCSGPDGVIARIITAGSKHTLCGTALQLRCT